MSGDSVRVWRWGADSRELLEVAERGGVLVVPTESSYALAVDPCNQSAVEAVFRIKRRAPDQPLPVVIGSEEMIGDLGLELPGAGLGGLERAWPGALSILLRCTKPIPAAASSGFLAVRVPGHEGLRRLLCAISHPLTATSANRSGEPPLLDARLAQDLVAGEDAVIVDDGILPGGPPSTLVRVEDGRGTILRQGRVSLEHLSGIAPALFSAASVEIPVEESR